MPRPQKRRKVFNPPKMSAFRPVGMGDSSLGPVELHYDEFEAFLLVEYHHLSQEDAAKQMDVSRPTLTRIYNNALEKITKAFVEGHIISIGGGRCQFEKDWHRCRKCHQLVENPEEHRKCLRCGSFGMDELIPLNGSL